MKTLFGALLALGFLAPAAQAQDWRVIGVIPSTGMIAIIDAEGIDRTGPNPVARIVVVMAPDRKPFAAMDGRVGFDCKAKLMRGLEGVAFDGAGNTVFNAGSEPEWGTPPPGSPFELAYRVVCENAQPGERIGTGAALPFARGRELLAAAQTGRR
ncbi:hypothetical protein P1X14_18135 [Sphingomonas sp. AOB5]|uniref:surface-adhesin E family protein n=1 Tax=Sphingomonas sp. AOB5 TaxID=3034017 RepID=UPI0023F71C3C|nr:surface-adhesin E family protein [Sphingomonas sp. AOB5]MDF7777184.1 hypothetical protein [Sphingomonas sp. AOB5]